MRTTDRFQQRLIEVRTRIENDRSTDRRGLLRTLVVDAAGRTVARRDSTFSLAAGQQLELQQRLWGEAELSR